MAMMMIFLVIRPTSVHFDPFRDWIQDALTVDLGEAATELRSAERTKVRSLQFTPQIIIFFTHTHSFSPHS
jgi:hypothetical protein